MSNKMLYLLWAGLFVLCAGLGFVPQSEGFGTVVLVLLAVSFFLPGFTLLYRALRDGDHKELMQLRWLSIFSLLVTLILLVANFLCANTVSIWGDILYALLVILSTPMICGRYWVIGLFLWASLLSASFLKKK